MHLTLRRPLQSAPAVPSPPPKAPQAGPRTPTASIVLAASARTRALIHRQRLLTIMDHWRALQRGHVALLGRPSPPVTVHMAPSHVAEAARNARLAQRSLDSLESMLGDGKEGVPFSQHALSAVAQAVAEHAQEYNAVATAALQRRDSPHAAASPPPSEPPLPPLGSVLHSVQWPAPWPEPAPGHSTPFASPVSFLPVATGRAGGGLSPPPPGSLEAVVSYTAAATALASSAGTATSSGARGGGGATSTTPATAAASPLSTVFSAATQRPLASPSGSFAVAEAQAGVCVGGGGAAPPLHAMPTILSPPHRAPHLSASPAPQAKPVRGGATPPGFLSPSSSIGGVLSPAVRSVAPPATPNGPTPSHTRFGESVHTLAHTPAPPHGTPPPATPGPPPGPTPGPTPAAPTLAPALGHSSGQGLVSPPSPPKPVRPSGPFSDDGSTGTGWTGVEGGGSPAMPVEAPPTPALQRLAELAASPPRTLRGLQPAPPLPPSPAPPLRPPSKATPASTGTGAAASPAGVSVFKGASAEAQGGDAASAAPSLLDLAAEVEEEVREGGGAAAPPPPISTPAEVGYTTSDGATLVETLPSV